MLHLSQKLIQMLLSKPYWLKLSPVSLWLAFWRENAVLVDGSLVQIYKTCITQLT